MWSSSVLEEHHRGAPARSPPARRADCAGQTGDRLPCLLIALERWFSFPLCAEDQSPRQRSSLRPSFVWVFFLIFSKCNV